MPAPASARSLVLNRLEVLLSQTLRDTAEKGFTAREVRLNLATLKPFAQWPLAVQFLQGIGAEVLPVVVTGSASYEYDNDGNMARAAEALGRMLANNPNVALVTGGMPAIGQDVGKALVSASPSNPMLYNLLPKNRGEVSPPQGQLVEIGRNYEERQFVLGMSSRINVLIGGGPGATREANVTLASGGIVLPLACTGGAASGLRYDSPDPLEQEIDFELSKARALESGLISEDRWDVLRDPDAILNRAVRIVYTAIERQG